MPEVNTTAISIMRTGVRMDSLLLSGVGKLVAPVMLGRAVLEPTTTNTVVVDLSSVPVDCATSSKEVLNPTTTNAVVVDGSSAVVVGEGEELEDPPTADMQLPTQYGAAT